MESGEPKFILSGLFAEPVPIIITTYFSDLSCVCEYVKTRHSPSAGGPLNRNTAGVIVSIPHSGRKSARAATFTNVCRLLLMCPWAGHQTPVVLGGCKSLQPTRKINVPLKRVGHGGISSEILVLVVCCLHLALRSNQFENQ